EVQLQTVARDGGRVLQVAGGVHVPKYLLVAFPDHEGAVRAPAGEPEVGTGGNGPLIEEGVREIHRRAVRADLYVHGDPPRLLARIVPGHVAKVGHFAVLELAREDRGVRLRVVPDRGEIEPAGVVHAGDAVEAFGVDAFHGAHEPEVEIVDALGIEDVRIH